MRDLKFNMPDAAVETFEYLMYEVPPKRWTECFDDWFYQIEKCMHCNGEYFEKQ